MKNTGIIEIICGPMFAGKTEELIRRATRMDYAKKKYLVFKPTIDDRYAENEIVSHSKYKKSSINATTALDIKKHITQDLHAVIIDEVQFFDDAIIDLCEELANKGIRVIVGGLNCDFKGEPFYITSQILARAEVITTLTSICTVCGDDATKTQRLVNGKPAKFSDPIILVGASDDYEPRCRKCHQINKDE